jgi:hypothetical protein
MDSRRQRCLPARGRGRTIVALVGVLVFAGAGATVAVASSENAAAVSGTSSAWTGTMSLTSSREYIEGEGTPGYTGPYTCSDAWTGALTLKVTTNGPITGSLALTENGTLNCDFPFTPVPQATSVSMTVSGTASPSAFTLIFGPATYAPGGPQANLAGLVNLFSTDPCSPTGDEPGPPLNVPLVSPTSAAATPQIVYTMGSDCGGSAGDTMTATTNITLTRAG